ncbi:hypothetical protein evm_014201 [Chilo suppressalis]|nr:hypothetical protein evm_014201 [Chilo suppressalis]
MLTSWRIAGVRRANVTRAVQRAEPGTGGTERPSVVRAQLDRAPERDAAHHVYRAPHPHHVSGARNLQCWRKSFLAIVIFVHIDLLV